MSGSCVTITSDKFFSLAILFLDKILKVLYSLFSLPFPIVELFESSICRVLFFFDVFCQFHALYNIESEAITESCCPCLPWYCIRA